MNFIDCVNFYSKYTQSKREEAIEIKLKQIYNFVGVIEEHTKSKNINNKNCAHEFLYQYKGYNSMIIECWIWSNKKPYHRECELKLSIKDVNYCCNELCKESEW